MASSVHETPANATVTTLDHVDNTGAAGSESSNHTQTKRSRLLLSCKHCRHAKLKCDREKPCSQCVKRRRASTCSFTVSVTRKRPPVSIQNRLKHLESLVKRAMSGQISNQPDGFTSNSHTSSSDFVSQLLNVAGDSGTFVEAPIYTKGGISNSSGQVLMGPNETTYVGATHWAAMLDDIQEVQSYFNEVEGEDFPNDDNVRPDLSLIFNPESPATKDDLLAALPERPIVNRLIHRYFNSNSPALHIIHKPTFERNYRKFWADPHGSPINFLALIYSIMCLATFAALGAREENADTRGSPMEMIRTYRKYCTQCLVLSNYAQPGPYTLETFLIYVEGEFHLSKDDYINCYLIIGVAVRLALRMGFHRDSEKFGGSITPYQGEMRRRIWHLLIQMDLMVSFHIGLPSMVQAIKSDTRVPLNLRDQDFDEDTTVLPHSRPETEMTGMSYALAKGRIARAFGKIIEQANFLTLPHHDEVMALDRELHQSFAVVPPFLRPIPMELSITDSPQLIIQRLSLAVLFHKSRCILHRKYLMKETQNAKFSYSKKLAIDASMELLSIQSEVHDAVRPGGPLCKDLWILSSLSMHDLLLAGMIVYLSLIQESEGNELAMRVLKVPDNQQIGMIQALERSYRIWTETTSMSVDIRKASNVLGKMVKRVNSMFRPEAIYTGTDDVVGYNNRESKLMISFNAFRSVNQIQDKTAKQPIEPTPSTGVSTINYDDCSETNYQGLNENAPLSAIDMQFDLDTMYMPIDYVGTISGTASDFDWDVFDNDIRQSQVNDQVWQDLSFQDFDFGQDHDYNEA